MNFGGIINLDSVVNIYFIAEREVLSRELVRVLSAYGTPGRGPRARGTPSRLSASISDQSMSECRQTRID